MGPDTASSRRFYLFLFVSLIINPGMSYLLVRLVACLGTEYLWIPCLLSVDRGALLSLAMAFYFIFLYWTTSVSRKLLFLFFRWVDAVTVNCGAVPKL